MEAAAVIFSLILVAGVAALAWSIYKHGWRVVLAYFQSAPARIWDWFRSPPASSSYQPVGGSGKRRGRGVGQAQHQLVRFSDSSHKFSFSYPSSWTLARSENAASAVIVQATCDSAECAYMRFSVAWDDVSWSSVTAEAFGRGLARQFGSGLAAGSGATTAAAAAVGGLANSGGLPVRLVSHGLYNQYARADGAYVVSYTVADQLDGSELSVSDVIVVSSHGGRRRVYTVSFGCDAEATGAAAALCKTMLDSFSIDAPSAVTRHRSEHPAAAAAAAAAVTGGSAGGIGSDTDAESIEDTHVNIWERGAHSGGGGGGRGAHPVAGGGAGGTSLALSGGSGGVLSGGGAGGGGGASRAHQLVVIETPSSVADVQWSAGASIAPARLAFVHPAAWSSGAVGLIAERAAGGLASTTATSAAAAAASLRWWRTAYTCDRRESCFKQVALCCIDVTPLYDLMGGTPLAAATAAAAAAAAATGAQPPAGGVASPASIAVLLAFLAHRVRVEVAEEAAAERGDPPPLVAFAAADAGLRQWADAFAQKWPANCRLLGPSPYPAGPAPPLPTALSSAAPPVHLTAIALDQKKGAVSRLFKATGWLRTNGAAVPPHARSGPNGLSRGSSPYGSGPGSVSGSSGGGGGGGRRHSSSVFSTLSIDNEPLLAEGHTLAVTSAVLLGLHEAAVALPVAPPRGGGARTAAAAAAGGGGGGGGATAATSQSLVPRLFADVVAFTASSDVFGRYEGLAKHVFANLEVA